VKKIIEIKLGSEELALIQKAGKTYLEMIDELGYQPRVVLQKQVPF
jgi:hypothetical protein